MTNYTVQKLLDIYRCKLTPHALYDYESKGLIPVAPRFKRGVIDTRLWPSSDLPAIGFKIGFLDAKKIIGCKVLVFYFPKGGIGKTTNAINFARVFAINGIKTLYLETDKTNSGSSVLSKNIGFEHPNIGLNEVLNGTATLDQIIYPTELSTLDYMPAVPSLIQLEYKLQSMVMREFALAKLLSPLKSKYQIIVIDNPSNFGLIVQNTLAFCSHLIAPLQCEAICHQSLIDNISTLNQYKRDIGATWNTIYLRTMLADDNASKLICDDYAERLGADVCPYPIRRSSLTQSAYLERQSILEYKAKSPIADDYYNVICDVYNRITK